MRAIGINTYGGGFSRGVKDAGVNFLGSLETWEPGKVMAAAIGINRITDVPKVDMVVSNPPCSRFSSMSAQHFSKEQKSDLCMFTDLMDAVKVVEESQARVFWWENGPNCFTQGNPIIEQVHERLGAKLTLVLKLDPTYIGLIQLRPRTHVIHFLDHVSIKALPDPTISKVPVYDWMTNVLPMTLKSYTPAPDFRYFTIADPASQVKKLRESNKGFNSSKPALINEHQRYCYAILSSREFAWEDQNVWWSVPEYAAAMTFPTHVNYDLLNLPIYKLLPLFAKGVMPGVAYWVYKQIIDPMLHCHDILGSHKVQTQGNKNYAMDGIYYSRMLSQFYAYEKMEVPV